MAQVKYNLGPVSNNNYSTDEVKIGEWIDGKPIYRKIIQKDVTLQSGTSISVNHNIANIDKGLNIYGYFKNGDYDTPLPYVNAVNVGYCINMVFCKSDSVNNDSIQIQMGSLASNFGTKTFTIVLEYTKTTDTATS